MGSRVIIYQSLGLLPGNCKFVAVITIVWAAGFTLACFAGATTQLLQGWSELGHNEAVAGGTSATTHDHATETSTTHSRAATRAGAARVALPV